MRAHITRYTTREEREREREAARIGTPRGRADTRGLTLVETLVTLSLFTLLMLAITGSVASFYSWNAYTIAQAYQVAEARRGVERLVRDAREMSYADDGAFPLVVMDAHRIAFYSDIDRDDSVEYVEYELATTTLIKEVFNATGTPPVYSSTPDAVYTLSRYVQNIPQDTPTFQYYDADGALASATSTVVDIRYLAVQTIVNVDPVRDPGEFMLRSGATLRNLVEQF